MNKEPVNVLIFKDGYSSRNFNVSLGWFKRFGILLGILVFLSITSAGAAAWFYWKTRTLGPGKVQDLEEEVDDLRAKLLAGQNAAKNPVPNTVPVAVKAVTSPPAEPSHAAPPIVVAVPPPAIANGPMVLAPSPGVGANLFFGSLPLLKSRDPLPDATQLPFKLSPIHIQWQSKSLRLTFSIQYTATDGGNQTGRIIVLARGPQLLMGYPDGVLETPASDSIIDHMRGEYFSVSRFREVQATLGPLDSHDSIREIDALILNQAGRVLFIERLVIPKSASPAAKVATVPKIPLAAPVPTSAPSPEATP